MQTLTLTDETTGAKYLVDVGDLRPVAPARRTVMVGGTGFSFEPRHEYPTIWPFYMKLDRAREPVSVRNLRAIITACEEALAQLRT